VFCFFGAFGISLVFDDVISSDITVEMSPGASSWAATECHSQAALDIDLQLDLPRDQTLSTAADRPIYSSAATFDRQTDIQWA